MTPMLYVVCQTVSYFKGFSFWGQCAVSYVPVHINTFTGSTSTLPLTSKIVWRKLNTKVGHTLARCHAVNGPLIRDIGGI
jgi:hypothetical protein